MSQDLTSKDGVRTGRRGRRARSERPGLQRLVAPIFVGAILNPVNSSILAISLIPIGQALGEPPSRTAWLVSSLYLATAIGQPVVGRLVDMVGPRRMYLVGAVLVGLGGVVSTLSQDLWFLVAGRVVLGVGTCAGYPVAMYLIRSESLRTGKEAPQGILTLLTVANQLTAVVGPALGGLLIALGGWRATMAVNIPLALVCFGLGATRLPRGRSAYLDASGRGRFDIAGAALFGAFLFLGLLSLMDRGLGAWPMVAGAVLAGISFVWVELRAAEPFIDLRVLRGNLPLVATLVRTFLHATIAYSFLYAFTQWLQDGRGLRSVEAGVIVLPMFLTAIVVSTVSGRHSRVKLKLLLGATGQVLAAMSLLFLDGQSSLWIIGAAAVVLGVPYGLNTLANQTALYFQADPERMGASAGLLRTFLYVGAVVSSAATATFFDERADTAGLHRLGVFLIAVAGLSFALTAGDRSLAGIGRVTIGSDAADPASPVP